MTAEASVSEAIPTVVTVTWTSPEAGGAFVEYGLDGALDQATPTYGSDATEHAVTLLGLKADRTYSFRAVTVDAEGQRQVSDEGSFTLEPPPRELTRFEISEYDTAAAEPGGFVLTSLMQIDNSWAVIIDRDGDYVWWWQADDGLMIPTATFNRHNHSVTYSQNDRLQVSDLGGLMRVSLDGSEQVLTRAFQGHHDFVQLPDGTMAWLSLDLRTMDMTGKGELYVGSDAILELPEGSDDNDEPTTVFSFFDDYYEPYVACEHFWGEVYDTGAYDYTHANSLMYDADADAYLVMTKNLDSLTWIDRASGAVLRQAGGLHGELAFESNAARWSHGHMSHAWDGGFAVFDNGYHKEPQVSSVSAYEYDFEAGTIERTFHYVDPDGGFNPLLGDIQRLPDTWMVSWAEFGTLTELDADGEVVWRAETELGTGLGRATWVNDLYDLTDLRTF